MPIKDFIGAIFSSDFKCGRLSVSVMAYSEHLSFRAKNTYDSRSVLGLSAFTVITKSVEFEIEWTTSEYLFATRPAN